MSYNPDERRDTPLALKLKERIRRDGPITVAQYMQACLHDAEHGYYRTQAALGAGGDFVTAPEISQVFGELIGLWCAVVWRQMGSPVRVRLVELGPGRGTMLRDALRAAKVVPGFLDTIHLHLLDVNPILINRQRAALAASNTPIEWHARADTIPVGPTIVIANEWLDAQPVEHYVQGADQGNRRMVDVDASGRLQFIVVGCAPRALVPSDEEPWNGTISEQRELDATCSTVLDTQRRSPLAALFIDYGHTKTTPGDTLQAVRMNAAEHALCSPGEADLSAQVDFGFFAARLSGPAARLANLSVDGPVTQAEFLGQLGIVERASRLMAANPDKAAALESAVARLIAPGGMGSRFKAIGIRSMSLPVLPGFPGSG